MASTTITMFAHLQIPLEDVVKATDNFHHDNIIGRGGLGQIYKGRLQWSGELIKIAALRLDRKHGGGDVEFWTEVSMLSDLKHPNIVSIIGFCDEKHEKIIVTTHAAKGSLKKHLNSPDLTWTQRLKICLGVARALSYLHYDEKRGYGVIHLNINSSTILLDENWEVKLSGFKASIKQSLNRMDQVFLSEPIGTIGYMEPEIVKTKGVTQKSDIYAFGVVLFEMLCGRRAFIPNDDNRYLARLAKYHYENKTLPDIILPDLKSQMSRYQISISSLKIYSETAYSCLKKERAHRPHMPRIVIELEKALEKALKFQPRPEDFGNNLEHLKIRLDDIKSATNNFSDSFKFGFDDYYIVYTTELDHFDQEKPSSVEGTSKSKQPNKHTNVLVRYLPRDDEDEEKLFFTELEMHTSIKHHNISTLIGFCVEGFEMMLVMEDLSNGWLDDYLGNLRKMSSLTWEKRLKICIDVAHALDYLHSEMENKKVIIHGNIGSFNIGLNDKWRAKISDFQRAIFLPPNQKEVLQKQTYFESRYNMDPEYVKTGKLKKESDVYSFGVVLFQIICGRRADDPIYLDKNEKGLVHVARLNFSNGTIEDMVDPTLKEETRIKGYIPNRGANKDSLHTFLKVANQCVADSQDERPTMKFVLNELEKALVLQVSEEERVQPHKNQVVDELEIATHEIPVHSMDRDGEGSSELAEVVGDIPQLSKKHLKTGKQIQEEGVQRLNNEDVEALKVQLTRENVEEQVQPDKNEVIEEHEIAMHEHPEEQIQRPDTTQVIAKDEKALELGLTHEILVEKKLEHLKIPLSHIHSATNYFSKEYRIEFFIGGHAFYRAEVEHYDKENPSSNKLSTVLIKRYPPSGGNQSYGEKEFLTEIEILTSGVKHPNIVTLLGFCFEPNSEMILLLQDDFSNGFLGDYFDGDKDKRVLTWEKRLKICIDVAHALRYLHYEMEDQKIIINRDIYNYNIGLDENWGAKIVNFEDYVFLPPNQVDEALDIPCFGRPEYVDPEYKESDKLKRESDVYGFGVVLFETLCGRLAYDPIYKTESDKGLAPVARRSFGTGKIDEMIDPMLMEEIGENNFVLTRGPNKDSLYTFIEIAHKCIAETQDQRPTMKVVVKELEKALFFQKKNTDNPKMTLEDIKRATQNFHNDNCIGGGGFGKVYKGDLPDAEGFKTIVAKRLDTRFGQGEQQFLSELQILLDYKHENVIGLIGYCDENDEKIIIFEYASKGSLDRYLNDASLTWVKRLNICIDVASALYFFHGGSGKQAKVIHRDIKSANILLNTDWKAKLADFGLSLISPLTQETDYVIDHACGTPGYLDPLYRKTGFLTIESDIFSFGVVLFEILCGRSTFEIQKHEGHYLPEFIKNRFEEGKHDEVVFKQMREQIMPKSLTTFQEIAYQCLHLEREKRPTTKEVLMQLKKALAFQNMPSRMTKFAPLRIPLEDVVKVVDNFHDDNIIESCRFGTTYKGRLLRSGKEIKIVARRFDCKHAEGDLRFLKEISVLSDLKHTNLVSIIGFCDEKNEKIIVTASEANGCLAQYLTSPKLTWTQRLMICIGVARALSFLHYDEGRDYAIIHCNINSDTILLDDNWEAKLSSFEISIKQSVNYRDQVCLCEHAGTMGYMDPATEKTGGVTHKSDIYSFGVVLFETLCGRKAFIQNEADSSLAPLAKYHYENRTLRDIIDPHLLSQILSPQSLLIYSTVAYFCLNEDRALRPNMNHIVAELKKALELEQRRENIEKNLEHLKIRLSDIKLATDNFSEAYRIASGDGICTLYRAKLNHFVKENLSSGKGKYEGEYTKGHNTVVIKHYPSGHDIYGEDKFFTEIEMLSSVKHPNIVTLIGFCVEDSEMILVTENVSNGYLNDHLGNVNDMRILTWEKRLKICIDVAHALYYLHYEMEDQKVIINRDICSFSIGLDENWGAKIVHFGFSVFLPPNQEDEAVYLDWIGRDEYLDLEYKKTGRLKRESDVYSLGVVLFEILCGRKAFDSIYKKESYKGLAVVARQSFFAGTLEDMIDPILKEDITENSFVQNVGPNMDSLHKFIEIANHCVAETQDRRPTMKVVVEELEKALFFQVNGSASKQEHEG